MTKYLKHHKLDHLLKNIDTTRNFKDRRIFIVGGCELNYFGNYLEHYGFKILNSFLEGGATDPLAEINNKNTK